LESGVWQGAEPWLLKEGNEAELFKSSAKALTIRTALKKIRELNSSKIECIYNNGEQYTFSSFPCQVHSSPELHIST
jgi:hypothetical protein